MEATTAAQLPEGVDWSYEPKWDGFRCLAFVGDGEVYLQSKAGQPLGRYFPEIVASLGALECQPVVLDGELMVPVARRASFDDLLQRIHPAASRVQRLAAESPAIYVVFDLLCTPDESRLWESPFQRRRQELSRLQPLLATIPRLHMSPHTLNPDRARHWLLNESGPLDGVIAKHLQLPYAAGQRQAMVKVKRIRTADCVVGGFRYGTNPRELGSLLLGLYDTAGLLHHVGFCAAFKREEKRQLIPYLESLIAPPGFTGTKPGGPSRWTQGKEKEWQPLQPTLVVEVEWDHYTQGRFRHGTHFVRWRPDKNPLTCTLEQVASPAVDLDVILSDHER